MATEWQTAMIDKIAEKVGMGPFGSSIKVETFVPEGIPVISGQHLHGFWLDETPGFNFITSEHADRLKNANVQREDVIFTHAGNIGQVSFIPENSRYERYVISQRQFYMRCDRRYVIPEFVVYYFKTPEGQHNLLANAAQVGVPSIAQPVTYLRSLEIPIPPLSEQRAIAHILGTLDDKIELNRRMNETLEAIARAIFKSWFVDFDPVIDNALRAGNPIPNVFSGRSARRREMLARAKAEGRDSCFPKDIADLFPARFIDSDLGPIPEGWEVACLGDILGELVSGGRPKGGAVDKGVPSIGAENVIGLGKYDFSKEKYVPREFFEGLKRKGAVVRPGDVLLYKDGAHIGRKTYFECEFPHPKCAVNEHVFILRAKWPEMRRFLFFWLDQPWVTQEIISLNSNSAQPGINQPGVRSLPILVPSKIVISSFDSQIKPFVRRLFSNCIECRFLARLRDTMLPKLIRGKIRVRDAETFLKEHGL